MTLGGVPEVISAGLGSRLKHAMLRTILALWRPTATICHGGVSFRVRVSNPTVRWRVRTFATKEPETLTWIESMQAGDILWDVGANIGLYSLYAAALGRWVLALEPASANVIALAENVRLNGFRERVEVKRGAAWESTAMGWVGLASDEAGSALHKVFLGVSRQAPGQRILCSRLEDLARPAAMDTAGSMVAYGSPRPTHLKIDTNGSEDRVLNGATKLLAEGSPLRSMLIEGGERYAVWLSWRGWDLDRVGAWQTGGPTGPVRNAIFERRTGARGN